jgi:hypothetical protein
MVSTIALLHVRSCILLIASCFLLLCFFTPVSHTQSSLSSFLSQEFSLTDWELTDPSQIGYISVGILHKKEGKELTIHDIRRQRPIFQDPKGPRGRVPSFEGDLFLVSHFDQGNINRLGGYFGGFAKSPSQGSGSHILVRKLDGKRICLYWIPDGNWERFKGSPQFSQGIVVLGQILATPVPSTKLTFAKKKLKDLKTVIQQTKSEL